MGLYPITVNNSIIYDNIAMVEGTENYTNITTFVNSCTMPMPPTGSDNITNSPLVISPINPRLLPGSPCIDAGGNFGWVYDGNDKDGNPRLNGTIADIGAYEFSGVANLTGTLSVSITAAATNVLVGAGMPFTAPSERQSPKHALELR